MIFRWLRARRRRKLARRPVPAAWESILDERVPFFRKLAGEERARFLELVKVFVWEKTFISAGGMEITDEVKVVIAASAVRLIRHLDLSYYDRLTEIVVYPYVYQHPDTEGGILGEAQSWGTVVLSWPAVVQGLSNPSDGHETAAHEFAHVLDRASGFFDGTPELSARADYSPWAQVMSEHYLRLRDGDREERRVLRDYGATDEAEFFAVATEAYFERPRTMKRVAPDLYERLDAFYGADPAGGGS